MAPRICRAQSVAIDLPVLAFTAGISVIAGRSSSDSFALRASRTPLTETLKAGSRQVSARVRGDARASSSQDRALAVVLVVSAGLLIELLDCTSTCGSAPKNVLVLELKLPVKYPMPPRTTSIRNGRRRCDSQTRRQAMRRVHGVRSAAIAVHHPLRAGWTSQTEIVGRPIGRSDRRSSHPPGKPRMRTGRRRPRGDATSPNAIVPKRPGSSW